MKTARLLGFFLLASCSAETGGQAPPSPVVDAGLDASSSADASAELPPQEEGGTADASVDLASSDRSIWDDERVWPGYDGSNEPTTINWWDARGPDGQCILAPNWSAYVDIDPVTGMVTCLYPPGTWQHAICECVIEWLSRDQ